MKKKHVYVYEYIRVQFIIISQIFLVSILSSVSALGLKCHGIRGLNAIDLIAVRVRFLNAFEVLVFTFIFYVQKLFLTILTELH